MDSKLIVVKAAFDRDAGVWFVESSDLDGLQIEAATIEILLEKLPGAVADLLEQGSEADGSHIDVPIELIAHATTRVSPDR